MLLQMEWKLARGKWRPRLQAFVDALPADAVAEASTAAFAHLSESAESEAALKSAVNALTVLKVGTDVQWAVGFAGLHAKLLSMTNCETVTTGNGDKSTA